MDASCDRHWQSCCAGFGTTSGERVKPDKKQRSIVQSLPVAEVLEFVLEQVFERACLERLVLESFYVHQRIQQEISKHEMKASSLSPSTKRNIGKLLSRMDWCRLIQFVKKNSGCDPDFLNLVQTRMTCLRPGDFSDMNNLAYAQSVKVFSVQSSQDPQAPWSNKPQEETSGSGCVILHEGKECILTNAHVVADATYVEVRKAGDAMKYPALRVKTSHECDLALLRQWPRGEQRSAAQIGALALRIMILELCLAAAGVCTLQMAWNFFSRPKMSVEGKHVLITGGSQGLGLAVAKLCFARGARVTIVARTKAKLEQACEEVRSQGAATGAKIQYLEMDVSSMKCSTFSELMGRAAESFGRVDVVVANAGTGVAKLLVGSELTQLDELMEAQISTNLMGSLRCAIAAGQVMASDGQGGRICIVSSAAGLISLPGYSIYSATKFGHRGFLAGAYHELRRHGVHLSVYYPG
ncbi:KDSR, partial [Symbiodinium sp. CCMP2456]